jgi:homoserine dehydrogenase
MSRAPLRVGLLGAGTVGREVARTLLEHAGDLSPADGPAIVLTAIAVRDVDRARAAGLPAELLSDAPAHLVAAFDTDVIVELMGGEEPARTLIVAALGAGKSVVTANKQVLAQHGAALEATARRADAALRFEASVGGGVPVLGPLAAELAANRITAVRGIVNGTTNYILTAMAQEGRDYLDVLADAQEKGYAEADPSGDVEGRDAANKLVVLARLAFGRWIEPEAVVTIADSGPGAGRPGITGVTASEISSARDASAAIKLIAEARCDDAAGGAPIVASVLPRAVPIDSPLGGTDGVLNRIEVEASLVGTVAFSGPGAGGRATASAVLGDLIGIARGLGSTWAGLPPAAASR